MDYYYTCETPAVAKCSHSNLMEPPENHRLCTRHMSMWINSLHGEYFCDHMAYMNNNLQKYEKGFCSASCSVKERILNYFIFTPKMALLWRLNTSSSSLTPKIQSIHKLKQRIMKQTWVLSSNIRVTVCVTCGQRPIFKCLWLIKCYLFIVFIFQLCNSASSCMFHKYTVPFPFFMACFLWLFIGFSNHPYIENRLWL